MATSKLKDPIVLNRVKQWVTDIKGRFVGIFWQTIYMSTRKFREKKTQNVSFILKMRQKYIAGPKFLDPHAFHDTSIKEENLAPVPQGGWLIIAD